jgi:hypothetical protein
VKTIKVNIGSQSNSFKLETERLVGRKSAIALMKKLQTQAKALIANDQPSHAHSLTGLFSEHDLEPVTSLTWPVTADDSPGRLMSIAHFHLLIHLTSHTLAKAAGPTDSPTVVRMIALSH